MSLRNNRNVLLESLDSASCATDFANFQAGLAAEIVATERLIRENRENQDFRAELKGHLHLCHHLGDGLAWQLLGAHTIRQLAKNDGKPPYLSEQASATAEGLETIKRLAGEQNVAALMADLTNIIRIGDVIVPNGSQCPFIVEFKKSPRAKEGGYANRGSRQLLRMKLTAEYLLKDCGTRFGTGDEIRAFELPRSAEYLYDQIEAVCTAALNDGFAVNIIDEFDVLFCIRADQDLGEWLQKTEPPPFRSAMMGCHCRYLEDAPHPLLRPCPVWPVSLEVRKALLNRYLDLIHFIDPLAIVGFEQDGWSIEKLNEATDEYSLSDGTQNITAPCVWLDRWLYGFQTGSSTATGMLQAARMAVEESKKLLSKQPSNQQKT
jgi:hypothetical protein